jgi:hypothetical protein
MKSLSSRALLSQFTINASITLVCVVTLAGCVRPRQTTAIGSGVGGAIGAGLGAIVGNQSGNPGSGLAIGAAAGAATGALIGNALQAQEERTASTEEALKRQERLVQAQKSEIAELRSIRGDTSSAYELPSSATPRYRYRQPSVDVESPEVARQRARLQQRGPRPHGAAASDDFSYRPIVTPRKQPQEPMARNAPQSKVLARYDVRSELSEKPASGSSSSSSKPAAPTPARKQPAVAADPPAAPASKAIASESRLQPTSKTDTKGISESDIPVATQPTTAKLSEPVTKVSSECKEALAERDKAVDAPENSDKLFHLRRALRLCPNNGALHYELGRVYSAMNRKSDAESEFKQALTIDPSLVAAKNALGGMLKDEVQF